MFPFRKCLWTNLEKYARDFGFFIYVIHNKLQFDLTINEIIDLVFKLSCLVKYRN